MEDENVMFEAVANYGIMIIIAAVFILAVILALRYGLKRMEANDKAKMELEKQRFEREDKRYDQIIELTKITSEVATRGSTALESSTEALKAVQKTSSAVVQSVENTNRMIEEVCQDLKDQRHLTDKVFTELRVVSTKLHGSAKSKGE